MFCLQEEQKELEVQSEKSELLSQLNETKPEDTAAKLGKAPVVWSPLTVKVCHIDFVCNLSVQSVSM